MTPKLVIEQVGNYMVVYAQVPAWSMLMGYATIAAIGLYWYWKKK